jgi:hypothetical protein
MHVFYIIPSLNILRIIDIKFNPSLAGLQTKGKFPCPVCGPKMKSHHSRSLGKEVFDEYRHFLSKNHRYRSTEKHIFNGKEETGLKPQRMTPHLWKLQYNRNHQGMDQIVYVSYMKCLEYFIFLLHFVHCTN